MFADGMGGKQIAYALNDDGVPIARQELEAGCAAHRWEVAPVCNRGRSGESGRHPEQLNYAGRMIMGPNQWDRDSADASQADPHALPAGAWVIHEYA